MIDSPPPRAPRTRLPAALLAGLMLAAAFPPLDWGFLVWFAPIPLLWSLGGASTKQAAGRGYAMGLIFMSGVGLFTTSFGGGVLWMTLLPWLLFTAIEALWFIPVGIGLGVVLRRSNRAILAGVPAVWVLGEWARGAGPYGFPFGALAYAVPDAAVAQWASVGGCRLVSEFIVLVGTAFFLLVRGDRASRRAGLAGLGVVLLASGWGAWRREGERLDAINSDIPRRTVLLAQGDTNAEWGSDEANAAFGALRSRTLHAGIRPDLVVWSESAIPGPLLLDRWLLRQTTDVPARLGAPLLTGSIGGTPSGAPCNTAVLISPNRSVAGIYQKRRLVPFGEYVPLRNVLPFLGDFGVVDQDEVPGDRYNVLSSGPFRLGVPICFESAAPDAARAFTAGGANLLVVITNDAWFDRTGMARQHLNAARTGAIETGRWVVRCAHTGISAIISPGGEIRPGESLPLGRAGTLVGAVSLRTDRTPYVRMGEWFVLLCGAVFALPLILPRLGIRRSAS